LPSPLLLDSKDAAVTPLLTSLARTGSPHAVILTSLPSSSLASLLSLKAKKPCPHSRKTKLTKRQYDNDYAYTSTTDEELAQEETEAAELLEELEAVAEDFGAEIDYASEELGGGEGEAASAIGVSAWAPQANQTSIFAVKPNAGLLHRYVFFTPALIFGASVATVLASFFLSARCSC
jgi:hypothetical protein